MTGVDRLFEFDGDAVEVFTFFGQFDAVFLTLDDTGVKVVFDELDLLRDGGLGDPELCRRLGKTFFFDDGQERLQFGKIF